MENTLGAADDGEGHDDEPDFDLGPVDDMREALGGDGGMLGADADLRLIPNIVDFPELTALHPSEPPVAAAFNTVGSAAQKVRRVRVCELSFGVCGCVCMAAGAVRALLYMLMLLLPPPVPKALGSLPPGLRAKFAVAPCGPGCQSGCLLAFCMQCPELAGAKFSEGDKLKKAR